MPRPVNWLTLTVCFILIIGCEIVGQIVSAL